MSLIGDVMAQLESMLRSAVPTLPASTAGVERGWRPASQITSGEFPHAFLFDEAERAERLIFRQLRMDVTLSGLIIRRDSTHTQALADFDALLALVEAGPTLGGTLEQSSLLLDGVEREEGKALIAVAFSFNGIKVL